MFESCHALHNDYNTRHVQRRAQRNAKQRA